MKNLLSKSKELVQKAKEQGTYFSDTGNYDMNIVGYHSFNPIQGKILCSNCRCHKCYKVCFLVSVVTEFKEKSFHQENNIPSMD